LGVRRCTSYNAPPTSRKTGWRPLITSKFLASELIFHGILAPPCVFWSASSCVTNCHLGFFPWLLVFQGVSGCACALVCVRYLCFPGFSSCEVCSGWVTYCHRCLTCLKGLCCVCTQVSGSVVSNWPLCEFWTRVLWFFGIYILFLNFLRHQTMD
jgi:hypothetical protein